MRITYDNVRPITLTRNLFSQYCHYPQFESTVIGCFTRVRISERDEDYRFARIEGLVTVPKYTVEGTPFDQGLELSQGSGTGRKVLNMDCASNTAVTQVLPKINYDITDISANLIDTLEWLKRAEEQCPHENI